MNGGGQLRPRPGSLCAVVWILAALAGCGTPAPEPLQEAGSDSIPAQTFRNLELRETTEGKLEWVLRARTAWQSSPGSPTQLESLRVDFYQQGDEIRSVLTADSGRVDSREGNLEATGNVVVVTPDGNRLETEQLSWDRRDARVTSEVGVRLVHGSDVLTGVGFESDPNLEHFELFKEVRASVREEGAVSREFFGADSSGRDR
jgi:LPS export ABC transporter protein LptC